MKDDLLVQQAEQYRNLVSEYCSLAVKLSLDAEQHQRLDEILQQAESVPMLGLLLDEADHLIAHELGMIDENSILQEQEKLKKAYEDVKMEHLLQRIQNRKQEDVSHFLDTFTLQAQLRERGLYKGVIDGVFGPMTEEALMRSQGQKHFNSQVKDLIDPQNGSDASRQHC